MRAGGAYIDRCVRRAVGVALIVFASVPVARADDAATQWLNRVAKAARELNYVGTIVYQSGPRVETSRLVHINENGRELEKLVNLDGPAREVIRSQFEVRAYYPDTKIVRIMPRTFKNVFPSLSAEQQRSLAQYYDFRVAATERVGGRSTEVVAFEPKDGMRYGHRFWADTETGLLLKARLVDERGEVVEQFAFTDLVISPKIDRALVEPTWPTSPPDWQIRQGSGGEVVPRDTGWMAKPPPGFTKIMEGFRTVRGHNDPVAHLVYSDGLVSVSVFVEPMTGAVVQPRGHLQQGGLSVYLVRVGDNLVTVLGDVPVATVLAIGNSVTRR